MGGVKEYLLNEDGVPLSMVNSPSDFVGSPSNKKYLYVGVVFPTSSKVYQYISDDPSVKVGDKVYVETNDGRKEVEVVSSKYYTSSNAPYPLSKTKRIVGVVNARKTISNQDSIEKSSLPSKTEHSFSTYKQEKKHPYSYAYEYGDFPESDEYSKEREETFASVDQIQYLIDQGKYVEARDSAVSLLKSRKHEREIENIIDSKINLILLLYALEKRERFDKPYIFLLGFSVHWSEPYPSQPIEKLGYWFIKESFGSNMRPINTVEEIEKNTKNSIYWLRTGLTPLQFKDPAAKPHLNRIIERVKKEAEESIENTNKLTGNIELLNGYCAISKYTIEKSLPLVTKASFFILDSKLYYVRTGQVQEKYLADCVYLVSLANEKNEKGFIPIKLQLVKLLNIRNNPNKGWGPKRFRPKYDGWISFYIKGCLQLFLEFSRDDYEEEFFVNPAEYPQLGIKHPDYSASMRLKPDVCPVCGSDLRFGKCKRNCNKLIGY